VTVLEVGFLFHLPPARNRGSLPCYLMTVVTDVCTSATQHRPGFVCIKYMGCSRGGRSGLGVCTEPISGGVRGPEGDGVGTGHAGGRAAQEAAPSPLRSTVQDRNSVSGLMGLIGVYRWGYTIIKRL
jgi:hypothetical protein